LAADDEARQACARELGLDPGPALAELRQRIIVADPGLTVAVRAETAAPPPAARRDLPRDIEGFIGRDRETDRVLSSIDRPAGGSGRSPAPRPVPPLRVFAIDGMAGVGKTTLQPMYECI